MAECIYHWRAVGSGQSLASRQYPRSRSVVAGGANLIMLPMFRTANVVRLFVAAVDGRAGTCLLFETSSAVARIDDILACPGIDEVYVGLNDLHVEMRLDFMFELVSGGLVSLLAQRFADAGLPFGFVWHPRARAQSVQHASSESMPALVHRG